MVAAHSSDLAAAAAAGLRTAHVARPDEKGKGHGEQAPSVGVDYAAKDIGDLSWGRGTKPLNRDFPDNSRTGVNGRHSFKLDGSPDSRYGRLPAFQASRMAFEGSDLAMSGLRKGSGNASPRRLRDRKAVARYAGLTGSPDESGRRRRERGLARAGNARVRCGMI